MAIAIPSTQHRAMLAAIASSAKFGANPFNAIPCDERPASYADAVAKYLAAKDAEKSATHYGEEAFTSACDHTLDCLHELLEAPAPDVRAIIEKISIARVEFDGIIERDCVDSLLSGLRRLERLGGLA